MEEGRNKRVSLKDGKREDRMKEGRKVGREGGRKDGWKEGRKERREGGRKDSAEYGWREKMKEARKGGRNVMTALPSSWVTGGENTRVVSREEVVIRRKRKEVERNKGREEGSME